VPIVGDFDQKLWLDSTYTRLKVGGPFDDGEPAQAQEPYPGFELTVVVVDRQGVVARGKGETIAGQPRWEGEVAVAEAAGGQLETRNTLTLGTALCYAVALSSSADGVRLYQWHSVREIDLA
jgi:hypothetical protein